MKIAFDIDDTLWKCVSKPALMQVPDYDLIQVLRWFYNNGAEIYFWSAGGIDYAQTIIDKLGLTEYGNVISKGSMKVDIAFDDEETKLGTVDIRVKRKILNIKNEQEEYKKDGNLVTFPTTGKREDLLKLIGDK